MRYIGSKKALASSILQAVQEAGATKGVFADLFAGTGAVARCFKATGYEVIAADLLTFPYILQRAYIQLSDYPQLIGIADQIGGVAQQALPFEESRAAAYRHVLEHLSGLDGQEGYVYRHYTEEGSKADGFKRRYYTEENARKIDAVRLQIQEWRDSQLITEDEYCLLLATLLEAMPNVANVLGTFGAYKKDWEPRACNPLFLSPLPLITSDLNNRALCGDANVLVREFDCDILYLDPPYNARQYALFYHILETVALGDNPQVVGVTGKPVKPRPLSRYCTTNGAREKLRDLVSHARCQHIFLSYSSEGLIGAEEIQQTLALRGTPSPPRVIARHRRYRSDQDREGGEGGGRTRKYAENTTVDEMIFHVAVTQEVDITGEDKNTPDDEERRE